jgi:hypothetical protein
MDLSAILSSVIGFVVGGLIMIVFGALTIKFFIKRVILELTSTEVKGRFALWIEEVLANSIKKSLEDEKIRKIVLDILEVIKERLK